jgi:hypothetical protein
MLFILIAFIRNRFVKDPSLVSSPLAETLGGLETSSLHSSPILFDLPDQSPQLRAFTFLAHEQAVINVHVKAVLDALAHDAGKFLWRDGLRLGTSCREKRSCRSA